MSVADTHSAPTRSATTARRQSINSKQRSRGCILLCSRWRIKKESHWPLKIGIISENYKNRPRPKEERMSDCNCQTGQHCSKCRPPEPQRFYTEAVVMKLQAEVERLQNQLDHISFESYTLTISQANKRLHSKVEDLQAEVERLRKVFMHCIENGVMTQDAYEIYDELKAKAEGGEG